MRERGPMDERFEQGYVPADEPPGIEEREYRAWKAAGGQVRAKDPPVGVNEFIAMLDRLEQRHGCFNWHMGFDEVVIIIGQVQLALRHPANTGFAAERARAVMEEAIRSMEASEPGIGRLLRMGFDPTHDVPRGG